MTRRRSLVLLAASAWTLYVWITRLAILLPGDESVAFKVVHAVLAGVSLAFAVAVGWIGLDTLRRSRARPELLEQDTRV